MTLATSSDLWLERNAGMPFDLSWLEETRVNKSAVERRAATIGTRRAVKKEFQAAFAKGLICRSFERDQQNPKYLLY